MAFICHFLHLVCLTLNPLCGYVDSPGCICAQGDQGARWSERCCPGESHAGEAH